MNKNNPFSVGEEPCAMIRHGVQGYECIAMVKKHVCPGVSCSSYKTEAMIEEQRVKCLARIKSLSELEQSAIREMYGRVYEQQK